MSKVQEAPNEQISQGGYASGQMSGFSPGDDDQLDPQEYARLLDLYDSSFRNIAEGEVVKGTVLKVTDAEVVVDVGYKSEGLISIHEFL
ncbi:MAG: S1 RNA-binding domain-containing protein, partial [Chloroflexota bacterium]